MDPVTRPNVWFMLFARTGLFAGFQAMVAGAAAAFEVGSPWATSIAWWPLAATLTNIACVAALVSLFAAEGRRYRDLFRIDRSTAYGDLAVSAGLTLAIVVAAVVPNVLLSLALFEDPQQPVATMFRPLPLPAAIALVIAFPLTISLAEIPTYFGYVQPRLEAEHGPFVAVGLTSLFLAAQHTTLPLVFDWRFAAWRFLMFLPLALLLGVILRWRPRLLPYLAVVHGLLDLSAAWMVLAASR